MNVAFVGLGKLGFPCALEAANCGHDVMGYDISSEPAQWLAERKYPHQEPEVNELLQRIVSSEPYTGMLKFHLANSMAAIVAHANLIFIAVQTPHQKDYEGVTPMPDVPQDFDYTYVKDAIRALAEAAEQQQRHVTLVVISTVLPGTAKREFFPLLNAYTEYVYNPFFIAQTTVVEDYRRPEFVLLGVDKASPRAIEQVSAFYKTMHSPDQLRFMSVTSAELTKVAYNVVLSTKISIANTLMEISHRVGANVDDVTDALALATDRVISSKYLRGGMADGGPCHPRDIIAMTWLAEELGLLHDFFGHMVKSREAQVQFIAELVEEEVIGNELPVVILGEAYKKETNLIIGSAAKLLKFYLSDDVSNTGKLTVWDPHVDGEENFPKMTPSIFVIATDHDIFYNGYCYPTGSTIIDPWGKMPDIPGCKVIRVGRSDGRG